MISDGMKLWGIRERRDREKQDVRERMMDAARELFDTEGYAAVSMRKLADKIEYSPTAIYAYFKDKDDLLQQICHDDFAKFYASQAAVADIDDPIERIRQMGLAYIRFAGEHPNHFKRMFLDPPKFEVDDDTLSHRGDPTQDSYAFFRMAVAQAAAGGRFKPQLAGDVELLTQTLWAAVHGVAALRVSHDADSWVTLKPIGLLADTAVDAILNGLMIEPLPPKPKPVRTKVRS